MSTSRCCGVCAAGSSTNFDDSKTRGSEQNNHISPQDNWSEIGTVITDPSLPTMSPENTKPRLHKSIKVSTTHTSHTPTRALVQQSLSCNATWKGGGPCSGPSTAIHGYGVTLQLSSPCRKLQVRSEKNIYCGCISMYVHEIT